MRDSLLADFILVVHFAFVLFVVGGFTLTLLGAVLRWAWVRNPAFRYVHVGAIVFVALEALVGMTCPLTVWEDALRRSSPDGPGFIGRWVGRLLYYDLPEWVFATAYFLFAVTVIASLFLIPPHRRTPGNPLSS